jgi:hypothetical protein
MEKAQLGLATPIMAKSLLLDDEANDGKEDDEGYEPDYQVGLENVNVMKSASGGTQRGLKVEFDTDLMRTFEAAEKKQYSYLVLPKRTIAAIDIKGDPSPEIISKAVNDIKAAIRSNSMDAIVGRKVKAKLVDVDEKNGEKSDVAPKIAFLLKSLKVGFNKRAEPSIAVYEMQYKFKTTTIFLELESSL